MKELSLINSRLDKRYDVVRELRRGSYAEIFLARDTLASPQSAHFEVVIKALNVFLQNDLDPDLERTLVENFQNEAIALDRVRHPNIISRLGHGTARDLRGTVFHYLVLEYLAGGDLQRACREHEMSIRSAFSYIEQVCAGLRHAHNHGIIHRDVKPQNLLLTKDRETVKIADFGVARVFQTDAPITRVGTNVYAPPEHSPLLGTGGGVITVERLKPSSDIYSLAKSVYTIVSGESPRFYANQPITELPIGIRREEWAEELKRVLHRATLNDPEMRHQSIDEFWTDLSAVRRIAADVETATHVRPKFHTVPQPHVARGYTPIAPNAPKFDTERDLKRRHPLISEDLVRKSEPLAAPVSGVFVPMERVEDHWPSPAPIIGQGQVVETAPTAPQAAGDSTKRLRGSRRVFAAGLVLLLIGTGLYGTAVFVSSLNWPSSLSNPFASSTFGTANTDVNLRAGPSANTELIGLVTRNSRVRVLRAEGNWLNVEILEQGRERPETANANRGWLNGRFIDIDD